MEALILKSFTYNCSGGNGAGVVILNDDIAESKMQKIAADIGLSETAFVKRIDENEYNVRFFTPVCEVDLCGHATIAAFYYIGENIITNKVGKHNVYQNTKAGRLEIEISFKDGSVDNVLMTQANPIFFGTIIDDEKERLAKSLGLRVSDINLSDFLLDPTIVSTGLKDILIPIKDRQTLNLINPDFNLISDISKSNDVGGYHAFTIEDDKIYARNFAPLVGIDEECATGTSNGALGALLHKEGIKSGYFDVLQGEAMNELSLISVYIDDFVVKVGGKAKVLYKKYFYNYK